MSEDRHRSSSIDSLSRPPADRRVSDLVIAKESDDLLGKTGKAFLSDPHAGSVLEQLRFTNTTPIRFGTIVHAMPYVNWYKVQVGQGDGTVGACMLSDSSLLPIGVRATSPLPPNSFVLLWRPPGFRYAIILGTIPSPQSDGRLVVPDWVSQGGNSGFKKEPAHHLPLSMYNNGSVIDFNASRPYDATSLEWGRMSETGVGILIDPFQAYLRVNEMCGLFLNYWDSHMRLAGLNMDVMSAVHELSAREDEGEAYLFRGVAAYPWEALGAFNAGQTIDQKYDDDDVHWQISKATHDLPENAEDIQPFYRYREWGGYLGQGHRRMVVVPGRTTGVQRYTDETGSTPDQGVWEEEIGLDGSYQMRSAKQVIIAKRVLIPVPKRMRLHEDQNIGDDARKDNYKFSGLFGGTEEHKIGDIALAGEDAHILQVSAIMDVLTHAFNWKGKHPFHYHTADYKLPQDTELSASADGPNAVQDPIAFGALAGQAYLPYPTPKTMAVDQRYGGVEYFQRESFLTLLPDGSVVIGDGYGAQIVMSGGSIRLDCPGDVQLMPGRNVVAVGGDDIILRARNSLDASAGAKDLRLKAEKNLQIMGGNSGTGGVHIESRATSPVQIYDERVGEDVISSGITLKANESLVDIYGQQLYLRTGPGGDLKSGNIIVDAGKGERQVIVKADAVTNNLSGNFVIWHGQAGETTNVQTSHVFAPTGAAIGGSCQVDGNFAANGQVLANGLVATSELFASISGPTLFGVKFVAPMKGENASKLREVFRTVEETFDKLDANGTQYHQDVFPEVIYADGGVGNSELMNDRQFSYRDDPNQVQYNSSRFKLAESRWQTMVRLGQSTGGVVWEEPVVTYQNREQLPWPGKKAWKEDSTMVRLDELLMFDIANGIARDRPDPYEDPKLSDARDDVPPEEGYTVII